MFIFGILPGPALMNSSADMFSQVLFVQYTSTETLVGYYELFVW